MKGNHFISEGDRIAVCISGGKDSILMSKLFQELRKHRKVNFNQMIYEAYVDIKLKPFWHYCSGDISRITMCWDNGFVTFKIRFTS